MDKILTNESWSNSSQSPKFRLQNFLQAFMKRNPPSKTHTQKKGKKKKQRYSVLKARARPKLKNLGNQIHTHNETNNYSNK